MNEYYYERVQNNKYKRAIARRKSALLKRRIIMLVIFVLTSFFMIISIKHLTYAQDKNLGLSKRYQSVMIYCGDSVETISSNYSDYGYSSQNKFANEICSINNISEDTTLIAGNFLVIPYFEGI